MGDDLQDESVLYCYATSSPLMTFISALPSMYSLPIECLHLVTEYTVYHEQLGLEFESIKNWKRAKECYEVAIEKQPLGNFGEVLIDTKIRGTGIISGYAFAFYRLGFFLLCGMNTVRIDLIKAEDYLITAAKMGVKRAAALLGYYFSHTWWIEAVGDKMGDLWQSLEADLRDPLPFQALVADLWKKSCPDSAFILSLFSERLRYTCLSFWDSSCAVQCAYLASLDWNAQGQFLYAQTLLSQVLLASAIGEDLSTNKQAVLAVELLHQASAQGHHIAPISLSQCYLEGRGVAKNTDKKWHERIVDQAHTIPPLMRRSSFSLFNVSSP